MWKSLWKVYIPIVWGMDKSVENPPYLSTVSTFESGKLIIHILLTCFPQEHVDILSSSSVRVEGDFFIERKFIKHKFLKS